MASVWSWVTYIKVVFIRCRSLIISARIWLRSLASRLESGSSMRKTFGSRTIARPMATRWRWPPERALGLRSRYWVMSRISAALADLFVYGVLVRLAKLEGEGHVVIHRHVRVERVVLEDHRDVAVLGRMSLTTLPSIMTSPPEISSSPAIMRNVVDLPQPLGPTRTMNSRSAISMLKSCTATTPSSRNLQLRTGLLGGFLGLFGLLFLARGVRIDFLDVFQDNFCHKYAVTRLPPQGRASPPSAGNGRHYARSPH